MNGVKPTNKNLFSKIDQLNVILKFRNRFFWLTICKISPYIEIGAKS